MCPEKTATSIEPQLCEARYYPIGLNIKLEREQRKICNYDPAVGQHFVPLSRALKVKAIVDRFGWNLDMANLSGKAVCCWTPDKIQEKMWGLSNGYSSVGDLLSQRTYARLAELIKRETAAQREIEPLAPGFDGLAMLNTSEREWRNDWLILYPPALSDFQHYMEKIWTWDRPIPCPAGSFCMAGSCPLYPQSGSIVIDFNKASTALTKKTVRRLDNVMRKVPHSVLDNDHDDEDYE
jgi:hypothetical protein